MYNRWSLRRFWSNAERCGQAQLPSYGVDDSCARLAKKFKILQQSHHTRPVVAICTA